MYEEYANLIDKFSDLEKNRKKSEVKNELQEILTFLYELSKNQEGDSILLVHEAMKKLDSEYISDDEFINGVYAYLISIKEFIGKSVY